MAKLGRAIKQWRRKSRKIKNWGHPYTTQGKLQLASIAFAFMADIMVFRTLFVPLCSFEAAYANNGNKTGRFFQEQRDPVRTGFLIHLPCTGTYLRFLDADMIISWFVAISSMLVLMTALLTTMMLKRRKKLLTEQWHRMLLVLYVIAGVITFTVSWVGIIPIWTYHMELAYGEACERIRNQSLPDSTRCGAPHMNEASCSFGLCMALTIFAALLARNQYEKLEELRLDVIKSQMEGKGANET